MKVNISVLRAFNWWEVIFQRFYSIWGAGAELKAQSACSTLQLYGQRCRSTRLQSSYREYFLARRIDFLDFLCWHHHKYILLLFFLNFLNSKRDRHDFTDSCCSITRQRNSPTALHVFDPPTFTSSFKSLAWNLLPKPTQYRSKTSWN